MVTPQFDYDRDLKKHYVRKNGWLEAASKLRDSLAPSSVKYLTFCAIQAVDICLLHDAGIISSDERTNRLTEVFFCESDPRAYTYITEHFGIPGFMGDFSELILFDHSKSDDKSVLDPSRAFGSAERKYLRRKDMAESLRDAFPFDILNLDFTGPFFKPSEPPEGTILETVRRVLEWQTTPPSNEKRPVEFALFLTNRIDPNLVHNEALTQLVKLVEDNAENDSAYGSAFCERFPNREIISVAQDLVVDFLALSLPKLLIEEAAKLGWGSDYRKIYFYRRRPPRAPQYFMLSTICHFRKKRPIQLARDILKEALRIVREEAEDVDSALRDAAVAAEIDGHLARVIAHRKALLT